MRRILVALVLSAGGCAWLDADPPDRSCRVDRDCFVAQGERCDQASRTCETLDAGTQVDATIAEEAP